MELRTLATFIRVAQLRSFSQAARETGYSQSAVSTQIGQLERELGTPLFDRVGRTVSLTQQGQIFLEHAQNLVRMSETAKKSVQHTPLESGELRIAMAESLSISLFPSILTEYRRRFPQVNIILRTGGTDDMFRMLAQNEADLIYTLDRRIYQSDLVIVQDKPEPVCFTALPGHPLAQMPGLSLSQLVSLPFLLTEKHMSYRLQLDHILASRGLELTPCLELGNTEMIKQFVLDGMGLSLLPLFVVERELAAGDLVALNVTDCPIEIWRQLIYHKGKWVTPAMQAMFDLITDIKAEPPLEAARSERTCNNKPHIRQRLT